MINFRWQLLGACLFLTGCGPSADTAANPDIAVTPADRAAAPLVDISEPPKWVFPQRRVVDGGELVIHAPQVRQWPDFATVSIQAAIEYYPAGDPLPKFGTVSFSSTTKINLERRIVSLDSIEVNQVQFSEQVPERYYKAIMNIVTREQLEAPLDLFLGSLSADLVERATAQGFSKQPPLIHFASTPTVLLFINGPTLFSPVGSPGLAVIANANWPIFRDTSDKALYLLNGKAWLTAAELDGPWEIATALPPALLKLAEAGLSADISAAIPLVVPTEPAPAVIFVDQPTELILADGEPELAQIDGADELAYVTNTQSPLFVDDGTWYFLAAGRWFSTTDLVTGEWVYVEQLPPGFKKIPPDHPASAIRASVPGTSEANLAALEALLPVKQEISIDTQAPQVAYDGEPKFIPISDTTVARAVNTRYDILEFEGRYYLCYSGVWYRAASPVGPWELTAEVPAAIYEIPPSSPAYHLTHVRVYESRPAAVTYIYTPGYYSSVYVSGGVTVYSTGWYYPPYIYGYAYYPYYASYGHGSWYNPTTGRYGARSVAYGPYGGYSYNEGYNPRSGRYGYVETAWDNDEWASYAQSYNPRSGIGTETSRYYDEDHNRMATERDISRGNQSMTMNRNVDYDTGVANVKRQTAGGGSSQAERVLKNGTLTTQATVSAANGRSATLVGEQTRAAGTTTIAGSEGGSATFERTGSGSSATREATFAKGGQSVTTSREQRGNATQTRVESSAGGKASSITNGQGRASIARSGSGDLYAGHNGNVYRKTDSGWSTHKSGSWQQMGSGTSGARTPSKDYSRLFQSSTRNSRQANNRTITSRSTLNRDFSARQGGINRFSQRRNFSGNRGSAGQLRGAIGGMRGRR